MDMLIILCHYEEGAEGDGRSNLRILLFTDLFEIASADVFDICTRNDHYRDCLIRLEVACEKRFI